MKKIESINDLNRIKKTVQLQTKIMHDSNNPEQMVQIRVGMATCGIASGAREIMQYLKEETDHQAIDARVTQTGCLGYCYAEPTVEVTLPGQEPVVFGYVNKKKAQEIIDVYISMGHLVYPVLPLNFQTIDE